MPLEHHRPGKRSSIVRDKEWLEAETVPENKRTKARSRSSSTRSCTMSGDESKATGRGPAGRGHSGAQRYCEVHLKMATKERKQKVRLKARNEVEGKDVILRQREEQLEERREDQRKKYKVFQLKSRSSNPDSNDEKNEETANRGVERAAAALPLGTLKTPYMEMWDKTSEDLRSILLDMDITKAPIDGDMLYQMFNGEEKDVFKNQILEMVPYAKIKEEAQVTLARWMKELTALTRAASRTNLVKFTPDQWEENKRIKRDAKGLDKYMLEKEKAISKWRHYNPKNSKVAPAATQLALEKELRKKWAVTLLQRFIPHKEAIKNMKKMEKATDQMQEYIHLLGRARWKTLKSWNSQLKQIIKMHPNYVPWNEEKVRDWMTKVANAKAEEALTPAKFQNQWNVTNKLGKLLGMLEPEEVGTLVAKKDAVMEDLVQTITKKDMRAIPPNVEMVEMMEKQATTNASMVKRYYAAVWRFMLAASARFNDIQHAAPASMKQLPMTVEAEAWQTKTTRMASKKQRPVALIGPKVSLVEGAQWWKPLVDTVAIFRENEDFRHMDFLIPAATRDRTGFIPRPATNSQYLKVIREIMYENTPMDKEWTITDRGTDKVMVRAWDAIKATTNAAPRVWMPEWANKANIPREERAFLGRWADEPMADVYTREQRGKVVELWSKAKIQKDLMRSMTPVPTDMSHEHYTEPTKMLTDTKPKEESTPIKTPTKDIGTRELEGSPETPGKWQIDEGSEWSSDKAESMKSVRQVTEEAMEIGRMPANMLPWHLGGPLEYMARPKAKDNKPLKVHLITRDMKGIGCGTKADKYITPTETEINNLAAGVPNTGLEICMRCFKYFTWHRGQVSGGQKQTEEVESQVDSDSDSSNSDTSNDTVSEQEALKVTIADDAEEGVDDGDI